MDPIAPALAAALGHLHRSPGRDDGWVAHVLRALESGRPVDYDRLRRRLGLARSIAGLVPLPDNERATLAIGIFFHDLTCEEQEEEPGKNAQSWAAYLTKHEGWLAPCMALAKEIDSPDWESCPSMMVAVARIAARIDTEASSPHSRPLQTIQSLTSDTSGQFAQKLVEILWSEDGQRLCQVHFDRRGGHYELDPAELGGSLKILRESSPPAKPDAPDGSQESSGSDDGADHPGDSAPDSQPSAGAAPAGGFEQRRRALRSRSGWGEQAGGTTAASGEQQAPEPSETREETIMATQDITGSPLTQRDDGHLVQRLGELREKLAQIQMAAAEGQAILESLAPQLEEVSSWMADLETVIERWKSQHESTEAAA